MNRRTTQALAAERIAYGRSRRHVLKRVDQSFWDVKQRKTDPIDLLLAANRDRLPNILPIKMARMAVSPFGFFRGSVPLMAADLAALPTTKIPVQICGDAHVHNLGAFEAPRRPSYLRHQRF
jgi:hypothetical protein